MYQPIYLHLVNRILVGPNFQPSPFLSLSSKQINPLVQGINPPRGVTIKIPSGLFYFNIKYLQKYGGSL